MGPILLACFSLCWDWGNGYSECYVTHRVQCRDYEDICVETNSRRCKPVVVSIGPDNIIPQDYKPEPASVKVEHNAKRYTSY